MYICLLPLSMTLFVCHFIPPCEISEGIVVCLCRLLFCVCVNSYFVYLSYRSPSMRISDCGKVNYVVSMISSIPLSNYGR